MRFHGRNYQTWYKKDARSSTERFNYLYSERELAEWVPKIEQLAEQVQEVHVLMNNNRGNYAIVNAQDAMRLLGQPHLPLDIEPYPAPEPGAAREPRADAPGPAPRRRSCPSRRLSEPRPRPGRAAGRPPSPAPTSRSPPA